MRLHTTTLLKHPLFSYSGLFAALLLLSACSQQPLKSTLSQTQKAIPSTWLINAKLGIRNTEKSGSVTLKWEQEAEQYRIRISGPLGQGSGVLSGNQSNISVKRANKDTLYSTNPTQLIRTTFGWDLPLAHLNYWARGLTSPLLDITEQRYNISGTLDTLTQSGWSLYYSRYKQTQDWLMPHRIVAKKDGVVLTLIVKKWVFPNHQSTL